MFRAKGANMKNFTLVLSENEAIDGTIINTYKVVESKQITKNSATPCYVLTVSPDGLEDPDSDFMMIYDCITEVGHRFMASWDDKNWYILGPEFANSLKSFSRPVEVENAKRDAAEIRNGHETIGRSQSVDDGAGTGAGTDESTGSDAKRNQSDV